MFDFDLSYQRRAAELAGGWPYIAPASRDRVKVALAEGCDCKLAITPIASLKRRMVQGGVSIWLQCDGCGRALGSAMSRRDHPSADKYPPWDEELARQYQAAEQAYYHERKATIPTPEQRREQYIRDYQDKSRAYDEFLRTSPDWRRLIEKVRWRCRGFCEACMSQTAELIVHHLTYSHGKIPPAWELRAVCRHCHERMHTAGDDWCDMGMERNIHGGMS